MAINHVADLPRLHACALHRFAGRNRAKLYNPADSDKAGMAADMGWAARVREMLEHDRFKLVFAQVNPEQKWIGGPGVRFTLYDLENDPGETVNVAEDFPEDFERLQRELWSWENAEKFPVATEPPAAECGDQREMQDETREILKSLGYLR